MVVKHVLAWLSKYKLLLLIVTIGILWLISLISVVSTPHIEEDTHVIQDESIKLKEVLQRKTGIIDSLLQVRKVDTTIVVINRKYDKIRRSIGSNTDIDRTVKFLSEWLSKEDSI